MRIMETVNILFPLFHLPLPKTWFLTEWMTISDKSQQRARCTLAWHWFGHVHWSGIFSYQAGDLESWTCRWCYDTEESQGPGVHLPSSFPSSKRSLSLPLLESYLNAYTHKAKYALVKLTLYIWHILKQQKMTQSAFQAPSKWVKKKKVK